MLWPNTSQLLPTKSTFLVVVLIVVFVQSVQCTCRSTGNCHRIGCNDTLSPVPRECHNHVDEMNCFRVCKDPEELLTCFKDRKLNNTEEYCVLRYARQLLGIHPAFQPPYIQGLTVTPNVDPYLTPHPGLPCSIKCRVDPVFWACVHRCDQRGCFDSFRACEARNGTTSPPCDKKAKTGNLYMDTEDCRKCYVKKLKKEVNNHGDCIFRYSTEGFKIPVQGNQAGQTEVKSSQRTQCIYTTNAKSYADNHTAAWTDVDVCLQDIKSKGPGIVTVKDMEECYRARLQRRQIDLCVTNKYTPLCDGHGIKTANCQDECLIALTKPFCYVPCRRNSRLKECKEDCMKKWPTMNCLPCSDAQGNFTIFLRNPNTRLLEYGGRLRNSSCQLSASILNYTCAINEIYNDPKLQDFGVTFPEWEPEVVKVRNCKSRRRIYEFARRLAGTLKTQNQVVDYDESIENLADHFTFRECTLTDCNAITSTDAQACMRNCLTKERTSEEMEFVCNNSAVAAGHPIGQLLVNEAGFLRAEIVIWCLWSHAFKASFEAILDATRNQGYRSMDQCEMHIRKQGVGDKIDGSSFLLVSKILYDIEAEWCEGCLIVTDDVYHPYDLDHAKCEYHQCYHSKLSETCKPLKSLQSSINTVEFTECYWQMDYSLSSNPYRIWSTYFDEVPPHDQTHNLTSPNTLKYLLKSSIGTSIGHYVFPYFLVIRPVCENGFYDDNVYKFISSGGTPLVHIKYLPTTSRQKYVDIIDATFKGALVNLERRTREDKFYLPPNPLNRLNKSTGLYDSKTGCHLNICYPAFLVPQVLLHIPIFEVVVTNQQSISSVHTHGFATTLHLRDESGDGSLKVSDKTDPPSADEFFPSRKVHVYEDTQYVHLWNRLPDSGYAGSSGPAGPELEHITDHNCEKYPTNSEETLLGGNPFHPLDSEDFFQFHYTHGNAPQVVLAGFYDPNLVLIGDPDMRRFELVRWHFEVTAGSKEKQSPHLFHGGYPCFSHNFVVRGNSKPMYSLFDRIDPEYWLEFYRMRVAPKDYKLVNETKAIFSALTLEDRILFVTTSGIVSFYQNTNVTAGLGKAWEVEPDDRLKRCFKIVRVAKRAHPKGDTIVGVTYDYQVVGKDGENIDVSQQIWVGTYHGKGNRIMWQELTSGLTTENLKEERVFNLGGNKVGGTTDLPTQKIMGVPVERRETNPKSQIEAICYKTYRSNMGKADKIELIEDQGWCDAIDATPVIAVDQKIQVLVRMRAYFSGGTSAASTSRPRVVVFYVVASFNTDKTAAQSSIWQINSIIPRVPCQDEHKESIPSVVQFTKNYFRQGHPDLVKGDYGCHTEEENKKEEYKIFLHGMTYTRSYNHHLFLYGNKLLQSTDGGETFVQLTSFPEKNEYYDCKTSGLAYHKINVMAFDDLGHYAFLTSKRELWYGNLGSLMQIRIRPSQAYSMTLTLLPEVRELSEAVPFTVFFDSSNRLVEMVAVVDANITVTRIARRTLNERTIIRGRFIIEQVTKVQDDRFQKLNDLAKRVRGGTALSNIVDDKLLEDIKYEPLKWSVFCPFASPSFYHNFSERHGRSQKFFFPAPRQHLKLGNVFVKTSLFTYQAAAFNLIWNSFFNHPYRSYSFVDTDPFTVWAKKKEAETVLGGLTFLTSEPNKHGIFIEPNKFRRNKAESQASREVFLIYYMDYGYVVEMIIEYSISNDYTLNSVDYLTQHVDSILLNVDNANGSLIQINTDKEVIASRAAVRYVIKLSIKKTTGLAQSYPGRDGIQVPIKLHLIGGFGKCIATTSAGIAGDSIATVIQVGCPPSIDLVFDWASTLRSINFRDVKANYGMLKEECYNGEPFCFFARYPLILHFHIFDISKQVYRNFTGKYIMRIIGGGYSRDSLDEYTIEEQHAFNIPGVSDVSLIWNEWDTVFHQKLQRPNAHLLAGGANDSREIILQAGVSAIQLGCHTLSPCARITPRSGLDSVYYFKIFITNRGVDNDTLCLFEKEFVILLYGFPPSPEIQLVTTIIFYVCVISTLYIAYFCLRAHKKVWRSTTLKLYGWFQVIKDTLPKYWFKSAEESVEVLEMKAQTRKDEIILSLQGHLNVPKLVPKDIKGVTNLAGQEEVNVTESKLKMSYLATKHSSSSFYSGSEDDSSRKFVIDPVSGRAEAATWTHLIYEQIISRRLAAIIEKNRQIAEELKKKKKIEVKE